MDIQLQKATILSTPSIIQISGSKSETNRMLMLQALYPGITIENASNSDDSEVMQRAISIFNEPINRLQTPIINVHHAGTAMRFLTAFFAIQEGREVILTGSERMKERPIKILVEALSQLGAQIEYLEKDGFPPLKIKGTSLTKNKITLAADVSSQYISALLLIAPKLENGLQLTLEGEITSLPYIQMTLELLHQIGVETSFVGNTISVKPNYNIPNSKIRIESDWSSASYFYAIVAMSAVGTQLQLRSFKENSLQGDTVLSTLYTNFGVETSFENDEITIVKTSNSKHQTLNLKLTNTPDLAQTIAVTCFGLGIECHLSGLHTLKIKETDRLEALHNELIKLGANFVINSESISIKTSKAINKNVKIATYNDHRMAMAFAPLAVKVPIIIQDKEVVTKSYPNFWNDLVQIGFSISPIE